MLDALQNDETNTPKTPKCKIESQKVLSLRIIGWNLKVDTCFQESNAGPYDSVT